MTVAAGAYVADHAVGQTARSLLGTLATFSALSPEPVQLEVTPPAYDAVASGWRSAAVVAGVT